MVVFLRKQSDMMNAKQFVEGWLKLNCEDVVIPRYEVLHDIRLYANEFISHLRLSSLLANGVM